MTRPFARRGRRAPFSQVGDWVLVADIDGVAKAIYWALEAMTWRDTDDGGGEVSRDAEPSRDTLAEMFGYSRPQSVDRYLDQLESIGAIDALPNPGYPNSYRVHQAPPDDYPGPQTMGQWHKRRAERKRAEAEARKQAKKAAIEASPQVSEGYAPERTSPEQGYALQRTSADRRYAPERTGDVRPSAQGVCAPAHTKEEQIDPCKNPLTPTADRAAGTAPAEEHEHGRGSAPATPEPAPAQQTPTAPRQRPEPPSPAAPRCVHGQTSCRTCGTSPRAQAAAHARAEHDQGTACPMCELTPAGTSWVRIDPQTRQQIAAVPGVEHTRRCDHTTPHDVVQAEIAAVEAAMAEATRAADTGPVTLLPRDRRNATGHPVPVTSTRTVVPRLSRGDATARARARAELDRLARERGESLQLPLDENEHEQHEGEHDPPAAATGT